MAAEAVVLLAHVHASAAGTGSTEMGPGPGWARSVTHTVELQNPLQNISYSRHRPPAPAKHHKVLTLKIICCAAPDQACLLNSECGSTVTSCWHGAGCEMLLVCYQFSHLPSAYF